MAVIQPTLVTIDLTAINSPFSILNKEGILCHSFWCGNGSEEFKGLFVNLHLIENIRDFFSDGFQIIEINTFDEFEQDDSIFIIVKKLYSAKHILKR